MVGRRCKHCGVAQAMPLFRISCSILISISSHAPRIRPPSTCLKLRTQFRNASSYASTASHKRMCSAILTEKTKSQVYPSWKWSASISTASSAWLRLKWTSGSRRLLLTRKTIDWQWWALIVSCTSLTSRKNKLDTFLPLRYALSDLNRQIYILF